MVSPCTLWMTRSAGRAHRVGATPSGFLPARCSASSCSMMVGSLIIASRMPLKRCRGQSKALPTGFPAACARSSAFMLERLPNGERMDDAFQMGAICSSGGSDGPCGHNRNAASVAQPRGDNASTECSTVPRSRHRRNRRGGLTPESWPKSPPPLLLLLCEDWKAQLSPCVPARGAMALAKLRCYSSNSSTLFC